MKENFSRFFLKKNAQNFQKGRKVIQKLSTQKNCEKSKKVSYTPSYQHYPQNFGWKKWFT